MSGKRQLHVDPAAAALAANRKHVRLTDDEMGD
jgi:hypothetical protein